MADVQTVQDLADYYTNLLIIQYNNKPKARATIELFVRALIAEGIFQDVLEAYNLDTAVGVQLDVIGKYVGVDRFYEVFDLVDFFGLTSYSEVSPDASAKWGFCTYANFDDPAYNGTLNYKSIISLSNTLPDPDYRILIRLKILQNTENHSHAAIDNAMWKYFGDSVVPSSTLNMDITYTVATNLSALMNAAIYKKVLPRPMGVQLELVES